MNISSATHCAQTKHWLDPHNTQMETPFTGCKKQLKTYMIGALSSDLQIKPSQCALGNQLEQWKHSHSISLTMAKLLWHLIAIRSPQWKNKNNFFVALYHKWSFTFSGYVFSLRAPNCSIFNNTLSRTKCNCVHSWPCPIGKTIAISQSYSLPLSRSAMGRFQFCFLVFSPIGRITSYPIGCFSSNSYLIRLRAPVYSGQPTASTQLNVFIFHHVFSIGFKSWSLQSHYKSLPIINFFMS